MNETRAAHSIYQISPYKVPLPLIRSTLLVKLAAARCNARLGYLSAEQATAIETAVSDLLRASDVELAPRFQLDAFQGGAGTSINMNVNEAIIQRSAELSGPDSPQLDVYAQVNLHQSTNDVMPSALHLMLLDQLASLEPLVAALQGAVQTQEAAWAGSLVTGHTQLQDAIPLSAGRIAATWAGALGRDRWRIFKARERLKEVNLGGTAVGTGAGAPRRYVLQVIKHLQELTPHPVSRAEDLVEAGSNYDGIAEAMSVVNVLAQTLRRIANDIRLLASGPQSGLGLVKLPALVKGSSIMPGKINPVIAEATIQVAERVMANDALIGRLCSQSELQLNAFFPLISWTAHESLSLLSGICPPLANYIGALEIDDAKAAEQLTRGHGGSLALTPLFGYRAVESLIRQAAAQGQSLRQAIEATAIFEAQELETIFSARALQSLGYDEEYYAALRQKYAAAILDLRDHLESPEQ